MTVLPLDAMVLQEIRLAGSLGCPTTSFPDLLSVVATGKLAPKRLIGATVPVAKVSDVLNSMTSYAG
jgi:propanol-preferring alcohol dehydrogenase